LSSVTLRVRLKGRESVIWSDSFLDNSPPGVDKETVVLVDYLVCMKESSSREDERSA
jgi:hypothetical protein